ncbi:hypothetical protein AB4O94_04060 [Klebsiella quasipneumoniae]|uniref:hypothetical protein n=1 Tax=Klebsiella quasipneumoniae TaxID=1463165 RepID=UPI0034D55EDE
MRDLILQLSKSSIYSTKPLEAPIKKDSGTDHLIGAVITLLDGIPELMDSVEGELVDMDLSLDGKA